VNMSSHKQEHPEEPVSPDEMNRLRAFVMRKAAERSRTQVPMTLVFRRPTLFDDTSLLGPSRPLSATDLCAQRYPARPCSRNSP